TIDLANIAFDSAGITTISGNTLDIVESGTHYDINFGSIPLGTTFHLSSGGTGDTLITETFTPVVTSGQTLVVSSGQTSGGVIVLSGGTIDVRSGGTVQNTTLSGTELMSGTDSATTIFGGATETIFAGGTASFDQVSGGRQDVFGSAISTIVVSGGGSFGSQPVESGGSASITSVGAGGFQIVRSGGNTTSSLVTSGGEMDIAGSATIVEVDTGGVQIVSAGGTANHTNISGGFEDVFGPAISGTAGDGTGGPDFAEAIDVESGGVIVSTTVLRNTTGSYGVAVLSGGTASASVLSSGSTQWVSAGGTASATVISNGA